MKTDIKLVPDESLVEATAPGYDAGSKVGMADVVTAALMMGRKQ